MTRQQVFDAVVLGMSKQKAIAINESGGCQYRTNDGRKCAIGILLPDELYSTNIEANSVSDLITDYTSQYIYNGPDIMAVGKFFYSLIDDATESTKANSIFLQQLQECHDHSTDGNELFFKLKEFALRYELDYTILFDNEYEFSNWSDQCDSTKSENKSA